MFARINVNKVDHSLAGVTLLITSPQEYFDVFSCIFNLIKNEMH